MDPTISRLLNPCWMPRPDNWIWDRGDHTTQGWARTYRERPGQANLLWLALRMKEPPVHYDARENVNYMVVLASQPWPKYEGHTIEDMAALLSLPDFVKRLQSLPNDPIKNIFLPLAIERLDALHVGH